jgi:exodeoxyribonuclease VII large subunit
VQKNIASHQNRLKISAAQLNTVSPLATLARGYSITKNTEGKVVTAVRQVRQGDNIDVQLSDGVIHAEITNIKQQSS